MTRDAQPAPGNGNADNGSQKDYLRILIVVTALGGFLRFWHLGYNPVWLDEATTYNIALLPFSAIWQTMSSGGLMPPLFFWAEKAMLFFGNSESILRFIPAVAGTLTIPIFYFLGKEFLDRNAGLIAATGAAFSPFLVQYSQDARAYAPALLFVACATLFFLRGMRTKTRSDWIAFGLFSALAVWTHFYAVVAIAALVLCALIVWLPDLRTETGNLKLLLKGTGLAVLLCLPLAVTLVPDLVRYSTSAGPAACGVTGMNVISGTLGMMAGQYSNVQWALIALFCLGTIRLFFTEWRKGFFLIFVMGFVFAVSYLLSFHMTMMSRYLIFLNIVFLLGIAASYRIVCPFVKSRNVVWCFMALLVLINTPFFTAYYSNYTYEDWRGFAGELAAKTGPGDIVVSVPGYINQPLDYYYSAKDDGTTEYGATNVSEMEKIVQGRGNRTVWFVKTFDIYSADPGGQANQWLSNHTRVVAQESDILLSVYP